MVDSPARLSLPEREPRPLELVEGADPMGELMRGFTRRDVEDALATMSTLDVALVGETIIDEYVYCDVLGKSGKDPVLSVRHLRCERQLGGVLAIANHLGAFARRVRVTSALGEHREHEEFIESGLAPNVQAEFISVRGAPTIVKQRFLDAYSIAKLFGVYHIDDAPLCEQNEEDFRALVRGALRGADVAVVADYGHGLLGERCVEDLCSAAPFLCVNTQINAGNAGYHVVSRFPRIDFACLHEGELRLDARDRKSSVDALARQLCERLFARAVVVTLGKRGTFLYDREQGVVLCPALASKVVERVGAGDAVLAVTSLAVAGGVDRRLASVFGNLAGAQVVGMVGNRRAICKRRLQSDALHLVNG
jgi:bifunctional ADP-heptose synthase (sugar kinase/adenylyltransferase)